MLKLLVFLVGVTIFQPAPQQSGQQTAQNQPPADAASPTVIKPAPEGEIRSTENPDSSRDKPEWWGPETAPEWAQVILTVAAGLIAWLAFRGDKRTVRLTQRADVLIDGTSFVPIAPRLYLNTAVTFAFKNFGPTRASQVKMTGEFDLMGVGHLLESVTLDAGVIGPNAVQLFALPDLGAFYPQASIDLINKGSIELFVSTTVEYLDVFGMKHRTYNRGVYDPKLGNFINKKHEAD